MLRKENLKDARDFENLKTSCYDQLINEGYHLHTYSFILDQQPETVWKTYKSLNPKQLGLGRFITFGLSYSRQHQRLICPQDVCGNIEEGQIIFSGLKYLGGLVKLAVAQEITEINEQEKYIVFCYMEKGVTKGSQKIMIRKTAEGATAVIHETFYKSKSKFRDRRLYPGLHEKTIAELHENVRQRLKKEETEGYQSQVNTKSSGLTKER